MYDDEEFEEREPEEIQPISIYPPAPCFICERPDCKYGCFRCGLPVCYNPDGYFSDSTCGGWILDSWHPGHPHENEFYCQICLHAALVPEAGLTIAGIPIKAHQGVIQVTVGGEVHTLDKDDAASLIAYLFDQRGELFGKPYKEPTEESTPQPDASELVTVISETSDQCDDPDDSLGNLDDHPF
jgi:hypothetical protein